MKTFQTERLQLGSWESGDAGFVFDMYSRWEVQRFIGRTPRIMADRSEAVERITSWRELEHPVHGIWAVRRSEDARPLGALLLKSIPASGQEPLRLSPDTEIGWHFHPDYWGHGYAAEAASAVLAHGFAGGLSRIVAVTAPGNVASQRVCARIGMAHCGTTDRYYNSICELYVALAPQPSESAMKA